VFTPCIYANACTSYYARVPAFFVFLIESSYNACLVTTEQYDKSIQTGELQLPGFWARASHFGLPIVFLFLALFIPGFHLYLFFQGSPAAFFIVELWVILGFLIFSLLLFWMQKRRLKFRVVQTRLNAATMKLIIENVARELEWKGEFTSEKVYEAKTHPGFFSGSWGEQITILFADGRVFVNSICDPDQRNSVFSNERNRENEDTLVKCINDTEKLNSVTN